jgi:hypothetical protein
MKMVPDPELGKNPDTTGLTTDATDIRDSGQKIHYGHQYYENKSKKRLHK